VAPVPGIAAKDAMVNLEPCCKKKGKVKSGGARKVLPSVGTTCCGKLQTPGRGLREGSAEGVGWGKVFTPKCPGIQEEPTPGGAASGRL